MVLLPFASRLTALGRSVWTVELLWSAVLIMVRFFRWFPYEGHRHAIPVQVAPGEQGETLCGIQMARPDRPPPKYPDGLWPECPACDDHWRQAEGIAPRFNTRTKVPGPL